MPHRDSGARRIPQQRRDEASCRRCAPAPPTSDSGSRRARVPRLGADEPRGPTRRASRIVPVFDHRAGSRRSRSVGVTRFTENVAQAKAGGASSRSSASMSATVARGLRRFACRTAALPMTSPRSWAQRSRADALDRSGPTIRCETMERVRVTVESLTTDSEPEMATAWYSPVARGTL